MTSCSSCGQEVIWAISPAGARMPLDARPWAELLTLGLVEYGSTVPVYSLKGGYAHRVTTSIPADATDRYINHFGPCPTRDQHRQRQT